MLITNPVIEGFAVGMRVEGVIDGVNDGKADGTAVMKTDCISTIHSSSIRSSNTSMEAFTSGTFVASTVSCTPT